MCQKLGHFVTGHRANWECFSNWDQLGGLLLQLVSWLRTVDVPLLAGLIVRDMHRGAWSRFGIGSSKCGGCKGNVKPAK